MAVIRKRSGMIVSRHIEHRVSKDGTTKTVLIPYYAIMTPRDHPVTDLSGVTCERQAGNQFDCTRPWTALVQYRILVTAKNGRKIERERWSLLCDQCRAGVDAIYEFDRGAVAEIGDRVRSALLQRMVTMREAELAALAEVAAEAEALEAGGDECE